MFRNAILSMWSRRSTDALVVVEIALAFVAVFAVLAVCISYWNSYRQPLGFDYDRTWSVYLRSGDMFQSNEGWNQEQAHTLLNVLQAVRELPQVEAANVIRVTPFTQQVSMSLYHHDGKSLVGVRVDGMTSGGPEALGSRLVAGRWFTKADEGLPYRVAIANRAYVREAFAPGVDPLGKNINQAILHPRPGKPLPPYFAREVRLVGIVDHFRMSDLAEEVPFVITQYELEQAIENSVEHPRAIFLKVAPGTPPSFEKEVVDRVRSVAGSWRPVVQTWAELRDQTHSRVLMPVIVGAMLVAFVLVMVVLGLVGVVWQGVVRRTQEIGLRRAIGASAGNVRGQVVMESLVTAIFGVLIGAAVAIQLPLLQLMEQIDWASSVPALLIGAVVILALVALSALYPGWVASRREPADALRYE